MTTTVTIGYTVDAAKLTLTDSGRTVTTPAGSALGRMRTLDPVGFAAIQEFHNLGTTSGTVTVTAV